MTLFLESTVSTLEDVVTSFSLPRTLLEWTSINQTLSTIGSYWQDSVKIPEGLRSQSVVLEEEDLDTLVVNIDFLPDPFSNPQFSRFYRSCKHDEDFGQSHIVEHT